MNKVTRLSIVSVCALLYFSSAAIAEQRYAVRLCHNPAFYCIHAKRHDSWESLWPKEETRKKVMEVNRTNEDLYRGMLVVVPKHVAKTDYLDLAPFQRKIDPPGEKVVIVNPNTKAWAAYDGDGQLVRWGAASGGADWCKDIQSPCRTPAGEFRINSKGDETCKSNLFPVAKPGAPMPHCMHFLDAYALHGSPGEVPGFNASHGCVRLFVADAKWLNEEFTDIGTKVIIRPYEDSD